MSNSVKVLGIVAALLVLGALFTSAYGTGWMGMGHNGNGHHGMDGTFDGDDVCHGKGHSCDLDNEASHMQWVGEGACDADRGSLGNSACTVIEHAAMSCCGGVSPESVEESGEFGSCH